MYKIGSDKNTELTSDLWKSILPPCDKHSSTFSLFHTFVTKDGNLQFWVLWDLEVSQGILKKGALRIAGGISQSI